MNITIIGTGNVATILGKKIKQAGHHILQIYGRKGEHARQLAGILSSDWCTDLGSIDPGGDLYMVAVSDKALDDLSRHLKLHTQLVIHTAGSVSREVLKSCSSNYGVLYPLQSLRKELDPLTEVPLLTDANNAESKKILKDLAESISGNTGEADDEERMKLHVAAVITGNFVNHLYVLAEDYCKREELNFSLLFPLIKETASRISSLSPARLQTGPAIRGDDNTINRHIALLDDHPALQELYLALTLSIRENG